MEVGLVRDGVLDFRRDVLRRVVLQPDDGRAQQLDAVLRAARASVRSVSVPSSFA